MRSLTGTLFSIAICVVSFRHAFQYLSEPVLDQHAGRWAILLDVLTVLGNIALSTLWLTLQCCKDDGGRSEVPALSRQETRRDYDDRKPIYQWPEPEVTSFVLVDSMTEYTGSLCAICLDEFSSSSMLGRLPCNHIFHDECVRMWFKSELVEARCPMRCLITSSTSQIAISSENEAPVISSLSNGGADFC